jgi:hypothetical protein
MSKPSLALIPTAYKAGKLYSVLPEDGSGDFTVSRNGTGTYLGQDGIIKTALANEPRFEYNSDGTFKGILVEPAATNFIVNSSYNNIAINNTSTLTFTQLIGQGIYGMNSFRTVVSSSYISDELQVRFSFVLSAGFYTHRFYLKKGSNFQRVENLGGFGSNLQNESQQEFVVNGTTGVITQGIGLKNSSSVDKGDWWEITSVIYCSGGLSIFDYEPSLFPGATMEICGSQLEPGTVATSYIPTLDSQVTRPADVITRNNAQDLIGQTTGTIFIDYDKILSPATPKNIVSIIPNNNNGQNTIAIWDGVGSGNLGMIVFQARFNSTFITTGIGQTSISPSGRYKICLAYTTTQFKFFINGILIRTDNHNLVPSELFSTIGLGNRNSTFVGSGLTKSFFLLKTALTDQQAIALTTL